ncbi:MAG: hypothetical protein SWE60_25955 [Thermodesulfobacteriota bacterium]|nr:hypothetical protein [Thermodesulfobacteriota bacterium]
MVTIGDLVLVCQEEKPAFFARVEDISADVKPHWYQVTLLVLQVPVMETVWILRESYINGESFTMNGTRVRMEKVHGPSEVERQSSRSGRRSGQDNLSEQEKVISIFDRKKR